MKPEKQQEIALMRYGAIAPLIAGLDENYPSKTAFYTEISNKGLVGPDGHVHHYAPATIEKWYLDYQNHGFDALVPKSRSDAGISRKLDDELQERIRYFKMNYPRMSAAAIYRQLQTDGSIINGQVSESTVCRFGNQLQNELRQTPNRDMRRYERPHINEVWCGDSSVEPRLTDTEGKKHRIYIIALIDDASRFITGIDVFYNDNFVNLMSVMKSAVSKYGRPKAHGKFLVFCSLQLTKSACSAAAEKCLSSVGQPLSSVSGRKRYNILDFPKENRVPTGLLLAPIGNPEPRSCAPLDTRIFSSKMVPKL